MIMRHVSKWPACTTRITIFCVISLYAVLTVKTISCAMESFHLKASYNSTTTKPTQPDAEGAVAPLGCNTPAVSLASEVLSVC